jgi:hypothetical protein
MIYDQRKRTPQTILEQFNIQHEDLKFTINRETNNQITYLELLFTKKRGQIEMEVYRKPTTTDVMTNNNSCHPQENKLAAFKNWIHRLLTLLLNENSNAVISTALNNGYKKNDILILYNPLKHKIMR